jgi:hypothetical protein
MYDLEFYQILLVFPWNIWLRNVHVSAVPKKNSDALLILDKPFVQIYLNPSSMSLPNVKSHVNKRVGIHWAFT